MDGAVHNYDFALQIFGPAASAQASSLQFDPTSVGADTASVIVNFASGDQHTLIWSWGVAAGAPVASLNDVIGPAGTLQFWHDRAEGPGALQPGKKRCLYAQDGRRPRAGCTPIRSRTCSPTRTNTWSSASPMANSPW